MADRVTVAPGTLRLVMKAAHEAAKKAIIKGIQSASERGRTHLVEQSPVDEGLYKNSWAPSTFRNGKLVLINSAPYAGIIERGARPHIAPLGVLVNWVRRHYPGIDDKQVYAIAEGIRNKIAHHGIKGRYIVRQSLQTLNDFVKQETERELPIEMAKAGK